MNQKRKAGRPRKYPRESLVSIGYDFKKRQARCPELTQRDYGAALGISDRYVRHGIKAHREAEAKALARQSFPSSRTFIKDLEQPEALADLTIDLQQPAKHLETLEADASRTSPKEQEPVPENGIYWFWGQS